MLVFLSLWSCIIFILKLLENDKSPTLFCPVHNIEVKSIVITDMKPEYLQLM